MRLNVEPDPALWRTRVEAFVRYADLVKVSDEDLGLLYKDREPTSVARDWLKLGADMVIVTRGARGADAYTSTVHVPVSGRIVSVVDTVGAGDTFQAALIAALAEHGVTRGVQLSALNANAIAQILNFAVGAAAITCKRRGADLPTRGEL